MQASTSQLLPKSYPSNVIEFADAYIHTPLENPSVALYHSQSYTSASLLKKRKVERACDACRRRKIRCDGPRMSNNICTNCAHNRKMCSYMFVLKFVLVA